MSSIVLSVPCYLSSYFLLAFPTVSLNLIIFFFYMKILRFGLDGKETLHTFLHHFSSMGKITIIRQNVEKFYIMHEYTILSIQKSRKLSITWKAAFALSILMLSFLGVEGVAEAGLFYTFLLILYRYVFLFLKPDGWLLQGHQILPIT